MEQQGDAMSEMNEMKHCAQCGRSMENEAGSQGNNYFCSFECWDKFDAQKLMEKCKWQVPRLFALAESAKNVREYEIANIVFTYLLEWFLSEPPAGEWEAYLETEDPTGSYPNVHYDIFHIACTMGDFDGDICIPAPLLQADRLLRLMKHGVATCERRSHNRQFIEASPEYMESLYKTVQEILPEESWLWSKLMPTESEERESQCRQLECL